MFGKQTIDINIYNLRLTYNKNQDINSIITFTDNIVKFFSNVENLSWNHLHPYIRYSLESAPNRDFVSHKITDNLYQVYTYLTVDKSQIFYIQYSMLENWGVEKEDIIQVGKANMNKITSEAELIIEDFDGAKIGMISLEETFVKASIILSSNFRDLVYPTHGWPVYVVVPCRDFVYIISEKDIEFIGKIGKTVIDEYHNSAYPLTQDVLMISDRGIDVVGTYSNS